MKFPSIRDSLQDAKSTFLRFPAVIGAAAIGTIVALILADYEGPPQSSVLFKVLLAAGLGIPALISIALVNEKRNLHGLKAAGLQLVGILLLSAYGLSVPASLASGPSSTMFQFFLLCCALHLVVSVAPYTPAGEPGAFWTYNKTLFVRFLTAFLFANILWIGLAIALEAVNHLFGLEIPSRRVFELWIAISGIFMTWFFLSGVPRDTAGQVGTAEYPKGIKVFALYVLFPLVLVYLVILMAYMLKIVIAWDWPQGWVSKLILGYAGTAIFTLLLLHPIAGREENVWIKRASRWFYLLLIPLLVTLFLAVWRRVAEYGITPGRYFAFMMGFWLSGLVVYFLVSKSRSIRMIPASLCLVLAISSFGPWGMLSVSEGSQVSRLRLLAEGNGVLAGGKIAQSHAKVPYKDATQMQFILTYLGETHGFGEIENWFDVSLRGDSTAGEGPWKNAGDVSKLMSLWGTGGFERSVELAAAPGGITEMAGFDHMVHAVNIMSGKCEVLSAAEKVTYNMGDSLHEVVFGFSREGRNLGPVALDIRPLVGSLLRAYPDTLLPWVPGDRMVAEISAGGVKIRAFFKNIHVEIHGSDTTVTSCTAEMFYAYTKRY